GRLHHGPDLLTALPGDQGEAGSGKRCRRGEPGESWAIRDKQQRGPCHGGRAPPEGADDLREKVARESGYVRNSAPPGGRRRPARASRGSSRAPPPGPGSPE